MTVPERSASGAAAAVAAPVGGSGAQLLVLPDTLTHDQARACTTMLVQALQLARTDAVVADATALQRFDSSALAVLLACRREAVALSRPFSVRGLHPRLRGLADLYGVAELVPAEAAAAGATAAP